MSSYEEEARQYAQAPYTSPIHRPLPAVAISSWSELSYALQSTSVPQSKSSSTSRPRLHSSVSQPGSSTLRFSPYTASTVDLPAKSPRKRAATSVSAVTSGKDIGKNVADLRIEEERKRAEKFASDPALFGVFDSSPSFRTSSNSRRTVLNGKPKLVGETDKVLKNWPKGVMRLTVPGARGARLSWDAVIDTNEGHITRLRLLQEAVKAVVTYRFPENAIKKPEMMRILHGIHINAIRYEQGKGTWVLDFGF
ncbi:hypothetical protein EUX98_g2736 [Antrodiella citrinella]|uniref:Uncharacterized protein n=1 Tax=Antrodiella citrinella TaxID=2447956 RepID=A0A4S4MY57_9APHY|nr:hypothetical protein EUX98_g2736 [Antrodiella citrinella]